MTETSPCTDPGSEISMLDHEYPTRDPSSCHSALTSKPRPPTTSTNPRQSGYQGDLHEQPWTWEPEAWVQPGDPAAAVAWNSGVSFRCLPIPTLRPTNPKLEPKTSMLDPSIPLHPEMHIVRFDSESDKIFFTGRLRLSIVGMMRRQLDWKQPTYTVH